MDGLIVTYNSTLGGLNHAMTQSLHRWDFCLASTAAKPHLSSVITSYLFLRSHKIVKKLNLKHWSCYTNKSWASHITNKVSWMPHPTGANFFDQVTLLCFLIAMWCTLLHVPAATAGADRHPSISWLLSHAGLPCKWKRPISFSSLIFSVKPYFFRLIHH